jgi:hypothetical protein
MKNMKTLLCLLAFFVFVNYGFSQLKVDNLGNIGMGTNYPNAGYKLHVKGNVLLTNYPETPWYEFYFKVGIKNGAVIGSTSGMIDFYTLTTGYNKLIARQFITHSQWDKAGFDFIDGLNIIKGLNPVFRPSEGKLEDEKMESGEYVIEPAGLLDLVPSAIQVDEDGYGIDYTQIIPLLVSAIQEQQKIISSLATEIESLKDNDQTKTNEQGKNDEYLNVLFQNHPNPFSSGTTIHYCLKRGTQNARIIIYDLKGMQLEEHLLTVDGFSSISIESNKFKPGVYIYSLFINEKLIDTKKMTITSN